MFGKFMRWAGLLVSSVAMTAQAEVVDVSPDKIVTYLESQNSAVVQFTSPDKGCKPCLAAYQDFDQFAEKNAQRSTFVRVEWKPYYNFPNDIRKKYRLIAVPAQMCFRDGKKADALMGLLGKVDKRRIEQFENACF